MPWLDRDEDARVLRPAPRHQAKVGAAIFRTARGEVRAVVTGNTHAQWIAAADRSPYDAKHAGRNRVVAEGARVATLVNH